MIRGTYLVAIAVALLWCGAIAIIFTMFENWFLAELPALVALTALLVCPVWGISMLSRLFVGQDNNEVAIKDMQNTITSIERQIYERVTQSSYAKPIKTSATPSTNKENTTIKADQLDDTTVEVSNIVDTSVAPMLTSASTDLDDCDTASNVIAKKDDTHSENKPLHINFEKLKSQKIEENNTEANRVAHNQDVPAQTTHESEVAYAPIVENSDSSSSSAATTDSLSSIHVPVPNLVEETDVNIEMNWIHFIRAADFPQHATDPDTLHAIENVLKNKSAVKFLEFSEDMLALLAENNLFMEDYEPHIPPLENWICRPLDLSFDHQSLIAARKISGLIRNSIDFEKISHAFTNVFDEMLNRIFDETDGHEVLGLADTRSGRAYLLITRAYQILGKNIEAEKISM